MTTDAAATATRTPGAEPAWSQRQITVIIWRAFQGIAARGLAVTARTLIADAIPRRRRGQYQGALGAVSGVTTAVGRLLGGGFMERPAPDGAPGQADGTAGTTVTRSTLDKALDSPGRTMLTDEGPANTGRQLASVQR